MEEHAGHAGPDAHRIGPRVRRAVTTRLAATPPRRPAEVGFVLGAIRTLVLVPRLGELGAVAAELPIILAAAWIIRGGLLRDRGLIPAAVGPNSTLIPRHRIVIPASSRDPATNQGLTWNRVPAPGPGRQTEDGSFIIAVGMTRSEAAGTGAVAFVLLMLAEAALSAVLSGRTLTEHLALHGEPAHLLGLAGQIAFATFPLMRR